MCLGMGHLDTLPRIVAASPTPGRTSRTPTLRVPTVAGLPSPVTWPFLVLAGVHLLAQYAVWQGIQVAVEVADLSKILLLPSLWLIFDAGLRHVAKETGTFPTWWPWAAAALGLSWLGDVALISDPLLLAGMGLFGLAHVAYVVTFLRIGDLTAARRPRWLPVPYVAWWVATVAFLTWGSVPTLTAVAAGAYATLLLVMAWLATRISRLTAIGAALFVVSDSLIGLQLGNVEMPLHGVLVMSTYLAAQALIVGGLLAAARR